MAETLRLSPFVSEAMAAAKRGVKVRVLLNDDTVFGEDPTSDSDSKTANQDTVTISRNSPVAPESISRPASSTSKRWKSLTSTIRG